jgi:succinate-acetate transporter protein
MAFTYLTLSSVYLVVRRVRDSVGVVAPGYNFSGVVEVLDAVSMLEIDKIFYPATFTVINSLCVLWSLVVHKSHIRACPCAFTATR